MAHEEPTEPSPEKPGPAKSQSRRRALTPELRRFLNTPRRVPSEADPKPDAPVLPAPAAAEARPLPPRPSEARPAVALPENDAGARSTPGAARPPEESPRPRKIRYALLALGALLLLGLIFYGGTQFNYWRYLIATRHAPTLGDDVVDHFPGVAPADLIRQALAAEKAGDWKRAVDRFMSAKRKDPGAAGILAHVGVILYEQRDFAAADKAFERSIAFEEDLDKSNYYRGLVAARRHDFSTAEQFFQAATAQAPFVADFQYYCGEALRLDLKPKSSIPFYNRAALLAETEQDRTVCLFKIRMARIEAVEGVAVADELALRAVAGPLSVDWLMTKAALELRAGEISEARDALAQARVGNAPGLFASCANDFYFKNTSKDYPELAEVLRLEPGQQVPFPD